MGKKYAKEKSRVSQSNLAQGNFEQTQVIKNWGKQGTCTSVRLGDAI